MRKYFLLGAVAMLATSTANATTDYAEVTAKATIEVAGVAECTGDIDFGTIVMKANNGVSTVELNCFGIEEITGDVLSVSEGSAPDCYFGDDGVDYVPIKASDFPTSVTLTGEESGKTVSLTDFYVLDDTGLGMILNIPANVTADTYTGSFTLTVAY